MPAFVRVHESVAFTINSSIASSSKEANSHMISTQVFSVPDFDQLLMTNPIQLSFNLLNVRKFQILWGKWEKGRGRGSNWLG